MTLTQSRLTQAHHKVARSSGTLTIALATKKLKRAELHEVVSDLKDCIALIESILND
jgi:hypothetical protein